ncbi:BRCC3 [Symbiodinium microadriaticum]|nr:BRCC3 [Symbiodinium microadriaticum]
MDRREGHGSRRGRPTEPYNRYGIKLNIVQKSVPVVEMGTDSIFHPNASWLLQAASGSSSKADGLYEYYQDREVASACSRELRLSKDEMSICRLKARPDILVVGTNGKRSVMMALSILLALRDKMRLCLPAQQAAHNLERDIKDLDESLSEPLADVLQGAYERCEDEAISRNARGESEGPGRGDDRPASKRKAYEGYTDASSPSRRRVRADLDKATSRSQSRQRHVVSDDGGEGGWGNGRGSQDWSDWGWQDWSSMGWDYNYRGGGGRYDDSYDYGKKPGGVYEGHGVKMNIVNSNVPGCGPSRAFMLRSDADDDAATGSCGRADGLYEYCQDKEVTSICVRDLRIARDEISICRLILIAWTEVMFALCIMLALLDTDTDASLSEILEWRRRSRAPKSSVDFRKSMFSQPARGASPRRQVVPDVDDLDQQLEALNRKLAVLLSMACPSTVEAFMAPDPSRGVSIAGPMATRPLEGPFFGPDLGFPSYGVTGGRLLLSEQVYHACLAHALMSENEEIMGLLLGDAEGSEVRIWCSMTLRRSDKQPDRVEIAPEQLVQAVHVADELNKVLQCRTRVVGWYHSHPHITCFPSHVDLRTQLEYQIMDADFVGLIFGVFNYGDSGGIHHELIAFRTHEEGGQHQQRNLAVEVVPLCQLLSQEDEAAAVQLQEFGGFFGQSTICTVAEHTLAEVLEMHDGGGRPWEALGMERREACRSRSAAVSTAGEEPTRRVLQRDALEWMQELGTSGFPENSCVFTSLPDWSEIKKGQNLPLNMYVAWFRRALRLLFRACKKETIVVFYQTDICSSGQWLDKAAMICQEADMAGAALLWHKISFDPEAVDMPRRGNNADYSHLLCFLISSGAPDPRWEATGRDEGRAVLSGKCSIPDLVPRGRKVYAQGMGANVVTTVLSWIRKVKPTTETIVDPFCGRGTVLAVANQLGLSALGVDVDQACMKAAQRLDMQRFLSSETLQPVSFYLARAAAGRARKVPFADSRPGRSPALRPPAPDPMLRDSRSNTIRCRQRLSDLATALGKWCLADAVFAMAPESGLATPKLQRRSTSRQFRVSTFKGPEGKELEAVAAPTRQQDHAVSLTRLRQKASLIGTLFRVAGESIAPLEGYFQDSTKNCQVYSKIWEKPQEPEGSPEKSKSEQKEAELSTPKTQQTVEIVNGSPAPTEREDETPEQKSAASGRLPDHQAQQSKEEDAGGPETFVSSSSSFLSSVLPGGRDSGAAADSTDAPAAHVAMDCSGASEPDANVQEGSGQGPSVSASARVPPDADNITSLKNNFGEPGYCLCQLNLRSEYDTPRKCSRKSSPSALRCTQHLNSKTAMSFCNEMHLDWSCVRADLQNGAFRVEFHCDTPSSRRHPDAEGAKDKRPPARNFSVAAFGNGALKAVADYVAGKSYEALTKHAEPPTKKPRTR